MEPQTIVITLAAVVLVLYRQMRTRSATSNSIHYLALILIAVGLFSGGLVDTGHLAVSVGLLGVELVCAVAFGAVRAWTVHVWRDGNGTLWAKGTGWTLLGWVASVGSRVALYVAGHALGVDAPPTAILVFVGVTIGTQSLLVSHRARKLPRAALSHDALGASAPAARL